MRRRIYLAGPLATGKVDADLEGSARAPVLQYIRNCHRMIMAGTVLIRKGWAPFIPALDLLTGLLHGSLQFDDYFGVSEAWLRASEAFVMIAPSEGALAEKRLAESLGLKIYNSIEEVPDIKEVKD
jgi:hypothetical protein